MADPTIIRSDREQVVRFWFDRGVLRAGHDEAIGDQYIEKGTVNGGQHAADRMALAFARYRVQLVGEPLAPSEGIGACAVCQEPLFMCRSGFVCKNGHGC